MSALAHRAGSTEARDRGKWMCWRLMHRAVPQSHPSSVTLQQELRGASGRQELLLPSRCAASCPSTALRRKMQHRAPDVSPTRNKKPGQGLSRQYKPSCRQMWTSRLHFYKRTQLLGQNSALSSAGESKLGVGEHVLAGAMKQLFSKCLMGPQESPCVTQKCCYSTITMD